MTEKKVDKEFGLSSWAINNKTTIYVVMIMMFFLGTSAYFNMPRESFPEIKETKIYISSLYPGNTAEDIEKLITTPLENRLKTISNLVELTSNSQEDYSMIIVEFDETISVDQAKQKVLDMNNKTLENFVNQRKGNDSELANFARNELADRNNLNAWQDGSLINTDAINKLSLSDLERVAKILGGLK